MRLKFDSAGYVCCVLYGCTTDGCAEYEGAVPTEPEEYTDIDDWADRAKVQAYKLDANGNLIYDASKADALPDENDVVLKPYTEEECEQLNIAPANHTHGDTREIQTGIVISEENVAGGKYKDYEVTFNKEFKNFPNIIVGFSSGSVAGNFGKCCCAVLEGSESTTGFTIRFFNGDSSNRMPNFTWIATNFND